MRKNLSPVIVLLDQIKIVSPVIVLLDEINNLSPVIVLLDQINNFVTCNSVIKSNKPHVVGEKHASF